MQARKAAIEPRRRPDLASGGLLPALVVLGFALAVVLVRPPLPIDETRYLEVFRESLAGSPLVLRLLGEPYAEKTPLLFWIARALTWLWLSPEVALRIVPAFASAATVLVVARLGARAGLALAGWVQAALVLPALTSQFLLFDPLLALAVWAALDAWARRRDVAFAGWSSVALLAKGPVALVFLVPFLWSVRALRGEATSGRSDVRRAALVLALACVPLAAWALAAAARGGPEFANALLWERWAGRVGKGADHARSLAFYVPVVLIGALPGTPLLFRRGAGGAPAWARRLVRALGLVLLAFTLVRGKQAHYLLPAMPALSLWLAWRIENEGHALAWLRAGARLQLGLLLLLAVAGLFLVPRGQASFTARGREFVASGGAWVLLAVAGTSALAALLATFRPRLTARAVLVLACAGASASLLVLHRLAGELLFPHDLARTLAAEAAAPIAYVGSGHHGLYALLAGRDDLEKLADRSELEDWCRGATRGLLLVDSVVRLGEVPAPLEPVTSDVVHRSAVQVWRVRPAADALPP